MEVVDKNRGQKIQNFKLDEIQYKFFSDPFNLDAASEQIVFFSLRICRWHVSNPLEPESRQQWADTDEPR